MQKWMKGFIALMLLSFTSYAAFAQITVTGTVTDTRNETLIGVNVLVKGTTTGAVTDIDGKYSLSVPNAQSVLVFSYVGYLSQEVRVGSQRSINVTLEEDTQSLDEVVVVGYGTQRRSDVSTAIASASSENLKDRSSVNFGEALAGQLAGVQIQQTTGMPGEDAIKIRIRGTSSITQSNEPLYVVDGFPMEASAFNLVSPSDIETIQILKDASSSAIYGSRGANGVVLITTKKGQAGKPTVRLNAFVGFQQVERQLKMMNRDQYVDWVIDGRNQAWLDAPLNSADPNQSPHTINDPNSRRELYASASTLYMIPDGTGGYKYNFFDPTSVAQMDDNNWQDLLFRDALMHQYDLSVSGGNEGTRYALSASYTARDGIIINTDSERFNFRSSLSTKVSKTISIEGTLSAFHQSSNVIDNGKDAPLQYALNNPPIYPQRNPDGSYGSMVRNPEILVGDNSNPISIAENILNQRRRYGWMGTLATEWEIISGLKYRLSINGGVQDNSSKRFQPSYVDKDASRAPRPAEATTGRTTFSNWVIENTLNFNRTFNEIHALNVMLGYSTEYYKRVTLDAEAITFPNDNITTLNAGIMESLGNQESENSMISYFGRVNYVFDNRYILTATLRADGSSRFGSENKWGTFPTLSAAWRISQEKFMQNLEIISDLKLRGGYGLTGNNRIGDYAAIGILGTAFYPTGGAIRTTVNPNTMPNPILGWEKKREYNLGLEIGLLNNRVHLEADFYDSQSIDLLLNVPVPRITGYASQVQNIGKVSNRGMDLTLNTRNFIGDFKWSTDFNIAFNKNKVLELGPDGQPIYGSAPNANNAFVTRVGDEIGSFWGYVFEGVFMSQADLDKYPHLAVDRVGDGRYKDVDGNNIMDANDKEILGSNQPIFTAGLNNSFSYKNLSLGIQLTSSYGAETFSFWKRMSGIYHGDRNATVDQLNRWRSPEDPGDGIHFRATRNPTGWQRDPSSAWVQDASYLRVRNVTLGYDVDKALTQKIGITGLHFYITGSNLYTWTKYQGFDPEASSEGTSSNNSNFNLSLGGDYASYPSARSFIFGANITF
ncbi:MAG: TonB-dependent receptor [Tannerella sp.]|nr:TonB-dependent receptor [Tannerella sp.]